MQANAEGAASSPEVRRPRSSEIAAKGVRTATEFAGLMSALMTEVLEGNVTPGVCNAAVNAGGKLLKVVEMQQRYGTVTPSGKELQLATISPATADGGEAPPEATRQRVEELEAELATLRNGRRAPARA